MYKSEARYCKEAVASVALVTSCPTSKSEWDIAAHKKNCSEIASQQNCAPVDMFSYHCVINGYRNETLEVCAPSRIIFGVSIIYNHIQFYTYSLYSFKVCSFFQNMKFFSSSWIYCQVCTIFRPLCRVQSSRRSHSGSVVISLQWNISEMWFDLWFNSGL